MNILVFGKKGFLASKLKKKFKEKKIIAKFIGSKDINLAKKNSVSKLKRYKKKI